MPKEFTDKTIRTISSGNSTDGVYINKTRTIAIDSRNESEDYAICANEHCNRKFIPATSYQRYCTKKCQTSWGNKLRMIKANNKGK